MSHAYVELRSTPKTIGLDLIKHLYSRATPGLVIIIHDKPVVFKSVLAKQWRAVLRELKHARSSTLDPQKLRELNTRYSLIERVYFALYLPPEDKEGKVRTSMEVAIVPSLDIPVPKECHTLYLFTGEKLTFPKDSNTLIVSYT